MNEIPKKAALVSAGEDGETELEAIDNALLKAGIGNLNLVPVSSIFPPKCEFSALPEIKPGTITPTAIAQVSSSKTGQRISASVSVAMSEKSEGVISEYEGKKIGKEKAREKSESMAKRMIRKRGLEIKKIKTASAEHVVKKSGAAIAAVVFVF